MCSEVGSGFKLEYIWVLAREPIISDSFIKEIERKIDEEIPGYDKTILIKVK